MTHYFIKQGKTKFKIGPIVATSIFLALRKAGHKTDRRIGARYDSVRHHAVINGIKFTLTQRKYK